MSAKVRWAGVVFGFLGLALMLVVHWQVFYWVSTERTMGVVQRIFYIHVPAAWVAFFAFGIVAICGAVYLWLRDERLDMAAVCEPVRTGTGRHPPQEEQSVRLSR